MKVFATELTDETQSVTNQMKMLGKHSMMSWNLTSKVKIHDNSFQTLYSIGVENFFEVKFQLIILCKDCVKLTLTMF